MSTPTTTRTQPQRDETPSPDVSSFGELGLPQRLVSALTRTGITEPFPIQTATIPDALLGRDVLGRGRTGSGKTLAFGLPTLTRLSGRKAQPRRPLAVVLVPTRELAVQVTDALEPLGRAVGVRMKTVVGGMSYPRQADALRRGVELVVATPGRLTDLVEQGDADLSQVELVVLDEADHMADMGFLPAVTALLDMVKRGGQRLLFSATLDRGVDGLVRRYLVHPVEHSTAPPEASVETMEHHILLVRPGDKATVTSAIGAREGRTLMFVRTQHGADRVATQLRQQGVSATSIHGGKPQGARTRALAEFREGRTPVLVATDVAARGIHVDDIGLVVHVDPPADPKDYLHRAGRTARAGEAGTVVTLVLPHQEREVGKMAARAGVKPVKARVRPGDAGLVAITGAREPSGVPVAERIARVERRPGPGRSKRPYGGGRAGAPRSGRRPSGPRPSRAS